MAIYRNGRGNRPLFRNGQLFGYVECEPGPATLGELSAIGVLIMFGDQLEVSYPPEAIEQLRQDARGRNAELTPEPDPVLEYGAHCPGCGHYIGNADSCGCG